VISLIIGPMMSGKTSELLTKLERAYIAKKKVILIRPTIDNRKFLSHSGKNIKGFEEIFVSDLLDFDITNYDVLGIDEGQFHTFLKNFCIQASLKGKDIYISALHATSESEMFEQIIEVLPYCDYITKLNAICIDCGSELGNYTFFKNGSKTEKVTVGGAEEYVALCEKCYFKRRKLNG
jgi:thymidine kinase